MKQWLVELCAWFIVALALLVCIQKCDAQLVPLVRAAHNSFVCYYDVETHNPAVVIYPLEWSHFSGNVKVTGRHFKMDAKLPKPRVKDGDFTNSGFVRGHLVSAADRDSNKGWLKETYLTSNLVPMTLVCNSGRWKAIEDSCRLLAMQGHRLLVARGPLYMRCSDDGTRYPDSVIRIGQAKEKRTTYIAVPDGFFCLAVCRDCSLRYVSTCSQSSYAMGSVIHTAVLPGSSIKRDDRVSVILSNSLGLWSQEEYETITH